MRTNNVIMRQLKKTSQNNTLFCLFDLMLYVHGIKLRSCRDGQ